MIFQIARLLFFGFIAMTVVYLALSWYLRSLERGRLEREWEEEVGTGDRDDYVRKGLEDYRGSLRRKLVWLVYILPLAAFFAILYAVNFM